MDQVELAERIPRSRIRRRSEPRELHAGWAYVASTVDVFSCYVVGSQASRSLRTDLASRLRRRPSGRGVESTSTADRAQVELLDRKHWSTGIEPASAIFEYLEILHNR